MFISLSYDVLELLSKDLKGAEFAPSPPLSDIDKVKAWLSLVS